MQSRRSGRRARMDGTIQVRNTSRCDARIRCVLFSPEPPHSKPLSDGDARPGLSNFAPKHLRLRWLPTPDAKDASSVDARPCRPRKRKRRLCNSVNGNPSWARPLELLSFSLNRQFYREMKEEVREGGSVGWKNGAWQRYGVCVCAHIFLHHKIPSR